MTINLFTLAGLGNIARNIVKSQDSQEENKSNWQKAMDDVRHNERMKNNSLHRDVHNIFSNIHNTAEKTLSAVSPAIEPIQKTVDTFTSFFPKKMSGKFFDDEKIFYENLRGDGYTDKKAKDAIYGRRKEMLGGREYLSNTEQNIVKEMRKNGYGSEEIFGVIGVHRQEEEARKQAAIQRKTDEKNAYMADASQGIIGGVDKDFKFHNTFGFLNDAGNFLTLKQNADDGFFESAGKMVANIPGNLLKIGGGIGNIASTAIQEGVYDTGAGLINQTVKMADQYADEVGAAYKEAEGRKGWGQGILNATNKVLEGATKFVVENPLDVMTMMKPKDVGTIYKGAVKGTAETAKIVTKPVHPIFEGTANIIKKYAGTPDEIAGIQSAIRPKVTRKGNTIVRSQEQINHDITLTNSLIRASGEKPADLATYKTAIKNEMQKVGEEINRLTGQNLEIDLSSTIKKLEDIAASKTTQILDSGDGNKISSLIENLKAYKGKLSVADAEDMNQWLNDTLKSPTSGASETTKRAYQVLVGDIRDGLDTTISTIPGQFKEIKKAYGSLRNVYGDVVKREIVYNRQNPTGLIESIGTIEGAGEIAGGMGKIFTGSPKEGIAHIGKGIMNNAVGRFITHKNDPNTIIKSIFAKNKGTTINLPNISEKANGGKIIKDGKNGIVKSALDMGRNLVANKEAVARANTIKNIIGVPKDVKISGLNNAILSTKFSNNDTAMIKKIAEKISQNKPLTEIQTKNLITIKKLIEEKMPQSEVEKFRQFLPNKDIGKGLTSINKKEPIVAMDVSNKNNIKTPFTHATPIKNTLTEVEQKYFNAIKNIKTKKNSEQIEVAEVPEFLGVNNDKIRPLYFTKSILHKITNGHGSFSGKNFIINANSWEYAIKYNDNGIDKIGLIKTIPNSNNIFVIHAERTNGYFALTNYEPNTHFDVMKEFAKGQIYNRNGEIIKQKDLQFSQK